MATSDQREHVIVLYDDERAEAWDPLTLLRPAGELLLGALTARRRAERVLGGVVAGHLTRTALAGFDAPDAAPALEPRDIDAKRPRVLLNARAVLDWDARLPAWHDAPVRLMVDSELAGWLLPAGADPDVRALLGARAADAVPGATDAPLAARMLRNVWDLIAENGRQLVLDIEAFGASADAPPPARLPDGVHVIGQADAVWLGRGTEVEPGVVFDTRDGPIWLDDDTRVRAFTRLAGPAYVGPGTVLLGGRIGGVSIGPVCKVHGELEETVILGYSNKAHDGFIGHAYLGEWVNIGALTTNSDLKNNYGTIRIATPAGSRDTGLTKLGALLGDHVKTGIGVMLNTGTVLGAGSSVFGATQPPKHVPPFSWGTGSQLGDYEVEKFLGTAATVMQRRGVALSDGMREVVRRAWHATAGARAALARGNVDAEGRGG